MKKEIIVSVVTTVIVAFLTLSVAAFSGHFEDYIEKVMIERIEPHLGLDCYSTEYGAAAHCAAWPDATPPACKIGYTFVGLSKESHTDGDCGISALNQQKVAAMCCKAIVSK